MAFKYIIFFCLIAVSIADQQREKAKSTFTKIHGECQGSPDTHVDDEVFAKLRNGEKVHDPKMGAHMLCMNMKMGVQKLNGDIDLEGLKKDLGMILEADKVDEVAAKCSVRAAGSSAEDAALDLAKCVRDNMPPGMTLIDLHHSH